MEKCPNVQADSLLARVGLVNGCNYVVLSVVVSQRLHCHGDPSMHQQCEAITHVHWHNCTHRRLSETTVVIQPAVPTSHDQPQLAAQFAGGRAHTLQAYAAVTNNVPFAAASAKSSCATTQVQPPEVKWNRIEGAPVASVMLCICYAVHSTVLFSCISCHSPTGCKHLVFTTHQQNQPLPAMVTNTLFLKHHQVTCCRHGGTTQHDEHHIK